MLSGILKCLIFALLGGIIAMVGDQVGRRVGRKRVSLFNLRPRYTSLIFTIGFGMMISIVTLGILAAASKEARTALFGMEKLEQERQKLSLQVKQLSTVAAAGKLVFHANQPIFMDVVQGDKSATETKQKLTELLSKANGSAIRRYNEMARREKDQLLPENHSLTMHLPEDLEQTAKTLSENRSSMVVMIYSLQNTFLGGQVIARFDLYENRLIFAKDQIITVETVDGRKSREEVLVQLFGIFSKLQAIAGEAGMIPNPETNDFGGNFAVATLLDKSDKIRAMNTLVDIEVLADSNIHIVDPLAIRLVLERKN